MQEEREREVTAQEEQKRKVRRVDAQGGREEEEKKREAPREREEEEEEFVSQQDVRKEDAKQPEYRWRLQERQAVGFDSARNVCVNGTARMRDVPLLQSGYVETWSE